MSDDHDTGEPTDLATGGSIRATVPYLSPAPMASVRSAASW